MAGAGFTFDQGSGLFYFRVAMITLDDYGSVWFGLRSSLAHPHPHLAARSAQTWVEEGRHLTPLLSPLPLQDDLFESAERMMSDLLEQISGLTFESSLSQANLSSTLTSLAADEVIAQCKPSPLHHQPDVITQ